LPDADVVSYLGAVSLIQTGGVGDGSTDCSAALTAAVAQLNAAGGGTLLVPTGTWLMHNLATIQVTASLQIVGMTGARIVCTGTTEDLFDVRTSFSCKNLMVEGFKGRFVDITEATVQVQRLELINCYFIGALPSNTSVGPWPVALYCAQQTGGATNTVGFSELYVSGCRFYELVWGMRLETAEAHRALVESCVFRDISEDGVWLGRDIATSAFNDQGQYVVSNNIFQDIGDGTAQSDDDRHAIILFGQQAVVSGNSVTGVDNNTDLNCEGIYTKVHNCTVIGNTLRNAGRGQGCIAQKGLEPAVGYRGGYNYVCSGNVITNDSGRDNTSAISVGSPGRSIIVDNIIDGMTDTAIIVGGTDQSDIHIRGNRITNTSNDGSSAAQAISLNCPTARVYVEDNFIDGVTADTGSAAGIVISSDGDSTTPYKFLRLSRNTIGTIRTNDGPRCAGILDNMDQNPSVEDYEILDNMIFEARDGIHWTEVSPRQLRLRVENNRFLPQLPTVVWQVAAGGPTFVDETEDFNDIGTADWQIFPTSEAVNDYAAIGCPVQFDRLSIVMSTAGAGGTVAFEYWNGSTWTALTGVTDDTTGLTVTSTVTGQDPVIRVITWTMPSDWATTTLNSVSAFYMRIRVTGTFSTNPVASRGWIGYAVRGADNLLTARCRFYRNTGFKSEAQGQASFSATTSVVVTHGCDWDARLDRRISIVPVAGDINARWWVTSAAGATFTINTSASITGTFLWTVHPHDEVYS
jgi:hypothetical protein